MIGWYAKGIIASVVLTALLYAVRAAGVFGSFWMGVFVVIVWAGMFTLAHLIRRVTQYTITSKRIIVRFGIVNRQEQKALLRRVQNTTIQQTLWERFLGVGSIDIDTAGYNVDDTSGRPYLRLIGVRQPQRIASLIDMHALDED